MSLSNIRPRIFLVSICILSLSVLSMSAKKAAVCDRDNVNIEEGKFLFDKLSDPSSFPLTFVYSGKEYRGLGDLKEISRRTADTKEFVRLSASYSLDDNISVLVESSLDKVFGEVEYVVWFENTGSSVSGVLENVRCADMVFRGRDPILRGCLGDHRNFYSAYEKNLSAEKAHFKSISGRATHEVFPYFDLVHGDGGSLIAIGWAGTWEADFSADGDKTSFVAHSTNDFRSVLLPGEKVRTALMVILPYKGRNGDDASNLWREWYLTRNTPSADKKGNRIRPFSTACWAGDTGFKNSDGSISERFYTWRRTLDRMVYEKVTPDFRWFDAGWYLDPSGATVIKDWYGTVGAWQLDTLKWPGKSFLKSNKACHETGMKVLMWFEPERVTHVEDLVKYHGYDPAWALPDGPSRITNNLGDPECLKWTEDRIIKTLDENGVDLYREDNNCVHGTAWKLADKRLEEKEGLPRQGITENKAIQGHYQLWDDIIKFCRSHGKCTFVDNCASGGGRNDIESLRRSIPLLRSDEERHTTTMRLSMSSTFNKWIPISGSSVKDSNVGEHGQRMGVTDAYTARASWLAVYSLSEGWTHDLNLDYQLVRKNYREWQKYNHLLLKDFYVLTPYHGKDDATGWTVFAYSDRKTGESVVEAFRQEKCGENQYLVKLPYAEDGHMYTLTNEDTLESRALSGETLREEGYVVKLDTPRSCAIWHIQRSGSKSGH